MSMNRLKPEDFHKPLDEGAIKQLPLQVKCQLLEQKWGSPTETVEGGCLLRLDDGETTTFPEERVNQILLSQKLHGPAGARQAVEILRSGLDDAWKELWTIDEDNQGSEGS